MKEDFLMPKRDGTGPMGMGSMTGGGMGFCNAAKVESAIGGLRLGCRKGFGRNCFDNLVNFKNQKDLLMEQKVILENRLNQLNNQLNTLQDFK